MNDQFLVTSWYKPRIAVRYLEQSQKSQFVLFFVLLFSYFFLFWLFSLYQNPESIDRILTFDGFVLGILVLILTGLNLMSLVYAASLGFWMAAQCVNGKASLPQTRAAVFWTAIWSIPTGFSFFIFTSTIHNPTLFKLKVISYVAILFSIIYGFIVLIKTLSEVNRFGLWRTIFSVIVGFAITGGIVYLTLKFYQAIGMIKS